MKRPATFLVVALAVILTPALDAQGKKPKPTADIPGEFEVRSAGSCPVEGPGTDHIRHDCLGRYLVDDDGTYVILNGNLEFRAGLYGARYVELDFSQQVVDGICGTNCFRQFGDLVIPQANTYPPEGPYRVVMQTNVVDAAGNETANGLMGLVVGESRYARFAVSFEDPNGRDFHWSVLFNPKEYPGSDHAMVTRTGSCVWTVEGGAIGWDGQPTNARAGLRAWAVLKGKNGNSDEGIFSMPFGLTFTAPNCGA